MKRNNANNDGEGKEAETLPPLQTLPTNLTNLMLEFLPGESVGAFLSIRKMADGVASGVWRYLYRKLKGLEHMAPDLDYKKFLGQVFRLNREEEATEALLRGPGWARCPDCLKPIENPGGCPRVRCPCGHRLLA